VRAVVPAIVAVALLACGSAAADPPSAAGDPPPEAVARAIEFLRREIPRAGFPGASLTVVSHGQVLLSTTVGVSDLDTRTPTTRSTLYTVASMTKSITAAALLQLRDRGLVDLDAPVQRYLPWFRVASEADSRRITLRRLLDHTSGLPVNSHGVVWQDPETIRDSLERGVRALRHVRLRHPPGAAFEYANMNYAVIGLIIEVVSGERWADYVERHLLRPLGMASTVPDPRRADRARLATPYGPSFGHLGRMPLTVGRFTAPASAVVSTSDDMARWANAQLGHAPPEILSPASLAEAHRGGPIWDLFHAGYGFGWVERRLFGMTVLHHGGAAGHSGAIYLVPERDLGVVLLVGAYSTDRSNDIAEGLVAILTGHDPPPIRPFGQLERLLWLSRILVAAGAISLLLLAWLAVRVLRGGRPAPLRRAALQASLLVGLAGFLWYLSFGIVPSAVPEIPIPFGFRGWPIDVAVSLGSILPCSYLWAAFSLVGLVRSLRRRG
jgi:CubicO group peptidase (beta-lactamase class C family)